MTGGRKKTGSMLCKKGPYDLIRQVPLRPKHTTFFSLVKPLTPITHSTVALDTNIFLLQYRQHRGRPYLCLYNQLISRVIHRQAFSTLATMSSTYGVIPQKVDLTPRRHHGYAVLLFIVGTLFPPLGPSERLRCTVLLLNPSFVQP